MNRRAGALVTVLALAVASVLTGPVLLASARSAASRGAACTESPFTSSFDREVRARWPGHRISAAVYDSRTGCQYRYRSDLRITTASVLKIEIMAGVLLRAQRAGRSITASERALIAPMIRVSDDRAAGALWSSLGGTAGMAGLERELGLSETRAASPWGLTSTSAADRNALLRQLVLGQWGPFSAATRATARSFLLDVAPSQRWGITAGVPPTWAVPLKNGFFPSTCCGWRINSSGVVERPNGSRYVATILSDGWRNQPDGVAAVEFVSRAIAAWNLVAVGPHRSAARFAQQCSRDVLGRAPSFAEQQAVAARIGTVPDRAGAELARLLGDAKVNATSGQVIRLYLGVLHRYPEAATWSGRVAQLRARTRSLEQVADSIAWSAELAGGAPLTTEQFVDRAYERTYGRPPSAADLRWWTSRIDRGATRGSLLLALIVSATFRWHTGRAVQVGEIHLAILRRLPTAAEVTAWTDALWAGASTRDVAAWLFASADYRTRFA